MSATVDFGSVLMRAPVGLLVAGHGAQKLLGWFGGDGPATTGEAFTAMGYRGGKAMAILAGSTEIAAGLGLAAGIATPLAAAGVIGVMTNAAVAAHGQAGLWAQDGGYEYPLVVATTAAGHALRGPGVWSVDAALGAGRGESRWGLGAIVLGVGTAAAALASRRTVADAAARPVVDTGGVP